MHKNDITPEIVNGIYRIFNSVCKPRKFSRYGSKIKPVEEEFPPEYLAYRIRWMDETGVEIRVTSEYPSVSPKLTFNTGIEGRLKVHFCPNLDWSNPIEAELIPKTKEISKQFSQCIKSYFRKIDRLNFMLQNSSRSSLPVHQ